MGKKVIVHEFDPVIYPYKIWICISNDLDNACEMFFDMETDKDFIFTDESNSSKYAAMALPAIKKDGRYCGTLIPFKSKKEMSMKNIAHESSHAAKQLFEYIGADIKQHEPFEYVVGWIAECCEKVLKNKE